MRSCPVPKAVEGLQQPCRNDSIKRLGNMHRTYCAATIPELLSMLRLLLHRNVIMMDDILHFGQRGCSSKRSWIRNCIFKIVQRASCSQMLTWQVPA